MTEKKRDPNVLKERQVWGLEDNERYFENYRNKPEDLYRSERFFLPDILKRVTSCLDVGCACGGFSEIMKSFNPGLSYTGVDVVERFIYLAKQRYPDCEFMTMDASQMEFEDNAFELCFSTGILHLTKAYKEIIREMYRVTSRYVLFDLRLTEGKTIVGEMDAKLQGQGGPREVLPYHVLNVGEAFDFLKSFKPAPRAITAKGYRHPPTAFAKVNCQDVVMAFFLIEKGEGKEGQTRTAMDLNA